MKKIWVILIATLFLAAGIPLMGQDQSQSPPPQDDQQQADSQPQDQQPVDQQQQQQDEQQQAASQPGVARVSLMQGDVSTQRGDNGQWSAATLNTPLEHGDTISTGNNSRAELQLDASNVARLSSSASAKVATLNRNQIQLQIGQGLVTYSVLRGSDAAVEIDTPNVAIRPKGEGQFRILVNNNAETQIVVRRGSADIATQQGSTTVAEGQMITIAGTDNPQYQVSNAPARDDWDNWNNDRDRAILGAQSWQHTDRYYTGSEDLDGYGHWENVPDYGSVWVPSEPTDWAPYRTGRWVYEPYYGWTWVSYEPWGWAPYHYGRWFVYGGSWAWWPGPVAAYPGYYPVWAPAYVSFFGWGGGGWGFGIGFGGGFGWGWGHVGWLPVGPGDWYHPWYGRWGGGVHEVNYAGIHNSTILRNGFSPLARGGAHPYSNISGLNNNARLRQGFTSMDGNQFGHGAVPGHQGGINEATLRQASLVSGKMPIQPTRAAYTASGRPASASTMHSSPSRMFNSSLAPRTSLTRNQTAAANNRSTSSFERPNSSTYASGRTGYSAPGSSNDRNHAANSSRSYAAPSTQGNWHTFTPPSNTARTQESRSYSAPSQSYREYQAPAATYNRPQESRGYSAPSQNYRQYQQPASASRGGYSSYRPPLNLRQPVVRPRGNYGGGSSPSYRGGGGNRAPSPSSGGGNRGGGGASHGGGGSHGGRGR